MEALAQKLSTIIHVDETKCVNCHACIAACPIKLCNDGSGDHVSINPDMCIGCGSCVSACTHKARLCLDDFEDFLAAASSHERLVAVVAPSAAASFPGGLHHLNGWLRSHGVEAVFDVSFGAELAAASYADHINRHPASLIIAQPCSAIVTYLEIYQPELVGMLAPVDSPMTHIMRMIRRHHPQFAGHKIAAVSPCPAKRREFDATGIGDYNIFFQSIDNHLRERGQSLAAFPEFPFDNPDPDRGVMLPAPGGLVEVLGKWIPGIRGASRGIAGIETVYDYFKKLPKVMADKRLAPPLFIDCLSCRMGCLGGPMALAAGKHPEELEHWLKTRRIEMSPPQADGKAQQELDAAVATYWERDLYRRTYRDLSRNNVIKRPDEEEKWRIFRLMHKHSDKDLYNCSSCGYGSCDDMAVAIHNHLNRPQNCHHFLLKERENAMTLIQERESRLRAILETTAEGFLELDLQGIVKAVNPSLLKILGRTLEAIMGRPFLDFLDDENGGVFKENFKLRQQNLGSTYELSVTRLDKTTANCLVHGAPQVDVDGQVIGSFGLVVDITDRKRAEKALLQSEEKYRRIVTIANEGIFVLDRDYRFAFVNDRMAFMLGYTSQEMLSKQCDFIVAPEEIADHHRELVARRQNRRGDYERQLLCKNGQTIWGMVSSTPVFDANGNFDGSLGMITDVTDRKRATEELRKSVHLQKSILNNIPDPAWLKDTKGRILAVNKAWCEIYGHEESAVVGKTPREFLPAVLAELFHKTEKIVINSGKPLRFEEQIPGKDIWFETVKAPLFDKEGIIIGTTGIARNITKRKRLEQKAEIQREQLLQASKMASLGVMAAGVAHEINNPNNTVVMNAPLLLRAYESVRPILDSRFNQQGDFAVAGIPYSEMRDFVPALLKSLIESGEKIRAIVNGLKEYSRSDNCAMDELVDVNIVCRKAVGDVARMLWKATERFEESYDPLEPRIVGNSRRLGQVVVNLLQNAIQALRSKDSLIRIVTRLDAQSGRAVVSIEDEGVGIPSENLLKIWDPFFTTKREAGGTGLGLPISIGIVKDHGGEIFVESRQGAGTVVTMSFPVADAPKGDECS